MSECKHEFVILNNKHMSCRLCAVNAIAHIAEQAAEIAALKARLDRTHKECHVCAANCLDTLGNGICEFCGGHVWKHESEELENLAKALEETP